MFRNKSKLRNVVAIAICLVGITVFSGCEKDDPGGSIGGSQSPIGKTGNIFTTKGSIAGVSNFSAQVVDLEKGVSSVSISVNFTNSTYLSMLSTMSDVDISGTKAVSNRQYRFTDKGIQSVYPEGKLNLINYNAKVGDVYTLKRGAHTLRREVTVVSKQDEFPWNGLLIKTIHVKETGRGIPGLDYIEYVGNHKFGIVAYKFGFEDGSTREISLVSGVTN